MEKVSALILKELEKGRILLVSVWGLEGKVFSWKVVILQNTSACLDPYLVTTQWAWSHTAFCQMCSLMESKLDTQSLASPEALVRRPLKAVAAAANHRVRWCTKASVVWHIPVALFACFWVENSLLQGALLFHAPMDSLNDLKDSVNLCQVFIICWFSVIYRVQSLNIHEFFPFDV